MSKDHNGFLEKLDGSAILTVIGIILLFSSSVVVTLLAPSYVDPSWTEPTSAYQVQMYEVADPNIYISNEASGAGDLQMVYHLKEGYTLMAFVESEVSKIVAPPELKKYVNSEDEKVFKLTSDLLLLREPKNHSGGYQALAEAEKLREELKESWKKKNPNWEQMNLQVPRFIIRELYQPDSKEAFARTDTDGITENWVDEDYEILDPNFPRQEYHADNGVLYVKNPEPYRMRFFKMGGREGFRYDSKGKEITDLSELSKEGMAFLSRKELVRLGEDIYKAEGCWYCHTDQTRTLIQDTVLNGSESYPAPPSSANEYVYQNTTFPGTRRIGPDLSRVGVKRPSRDWHKAHFWAPKTASAGTIMPAFRHFFDNDPSGTRGSPYGVPNYQFEAVFQYLMTKGTRITPPTKAWWLGKDPVGTSEIIEGKMKEGL